MEITEVIVVLVVAAFVLLSDYRHRKAELSYEELYVTTEDLPELVESLKTTGSDGSFFILLIPDTDMDDQAPANFQMSIEGDYPGIDWVLIGKRNVEDKEKFIDVVKAHNLLPVETSMNGVDYIRVENVDDFPAVSQDILMKLYGVSETTSMELIIESFDWPR